MDVATIDNQYSQLQGQAQQTVQELKDLAVKLQTASQAGNPDAREWMLDLKSIALAIQAEQNQVSNLLQALHGFVENQHQALTQLPQSVPQAGAPTPWQQTPSYPPPQQQPYPQQQGYPPQQQPYYPQQGGGGMLGGLLGSGFGRAIAMGAGFGIGDDIINKIF